MLPHSLFSEGSEFSKSPLDFICTLAKNLRTMDFAVMSEGIHHAKHSTINVPEALKTCTHVWVRVDRVQKALEVPYTGPFEVLERHDRMFIIMLLNGKSERISISHLKPTYLVVRSNRLTLPNALDHSQTPQVGPGRESSQQSSSNRSVDNSRNNTTNQDLSTQTVAKPTGHDTTLPDYAHGRFQHPYSWARI